jgi:long-chain fatty acid transport protein
VRGWGRIVEACGGALGLFALALPARASNPLEYPDNGSASFSRGGAWLAVANEPIATHYNPAGLATQASGFSVEQQLALPHVCYDRRGPGDVFVGPNDVGTSIDQYRNVCNGRTGFPNTIPSLSVVWRATSRLGFGVAIVPPAAYGAAQGQLPALAKGFDTQTGTSKLMPAPYRYMELEQQSVILFPTIGVGWEPLRGLRLGAAFISGMGVINLSTTGVAALGPTDAMGDHLSNDSLSTLHTEDLFVPGVVLSLHASPTRHVDVAVWGRYLDRIRAHHGTLDVVQQPFSVSGGSNPPCAGAPNAAGGVTYTGCSANQSVPNHFEHAVTRFEYTIPPEVRAGVRVHLPRERLPAPKDDDLVVRDPLHDDLFDVEVDGSFSENSAASVTIVRFAAGLDTNPTNVAVPLNADRPTGYKDSFGVRLGGQWNAVRDLLGVRAGGWLETESQDPAFLTVDPVGAFRFGFGGGLVVRYQFLDVSIGYQRQASLGLDNHGNGRLRAPAAVDQNGVPFSAASEPADVPAADRQSFRTLHAINGGSVSFDAHVFTLGGVARF